MKDKAQTVLFYTVCAFAFCYFLRIFNMPNELTVITGGLLCLVMLIHQKKLRLDIGLCLLTASMISYYVIVNGIAGLGFSILYIPLVIYELAVYIGVEVYSKKGAERSLLIMISMLVLGYTIHGILNSYMWFAGYAVPGTRRWPDFWNWEIVPGTQHAAYFMPAMSLFVTSVLYFKNQKVFNAVLIALTAFFGYAGIATRSRMTILIFAIVVMVQLLMYLVLEWERAKKQLKSKQLWISAVLFAVIAAVGAIVVKDSPVVVTFINNLSKDGGILNNARFIAQRYAMQQLFDYPMGGRQMYLGGMYMAHNTWLDMLNVAGLIPFFAFTGYTIYSLYKLIALLRINSISVQTKIMIAGLYGSFFLYFTVEPALEASIHWVTPWLWLNGLIHGWLKQDETKMRA